MSYYDNTKTQTTTYIYNVQITNISSNKSVTTFIKASSESGTFVMVQLRITSRNIDTLVIIGREIGHSLLIPRPRESMSFFH